MAQKFLEGGSDMMASHSGGPSLTQSVVASAPSHPHPRNDGTGLGQEAGSSSSMPPPESPNKNLLPEGKIQPPASGPFPVQI